MRALEQFEVVIPSLEIQEKIANVLDHFDAICSDLKIGLPAEIEARKKQYEYYRDQLLTFAESGRMLVDRQTDRQTDRPDCIRIRKWRVFLPYQSGKAIAVAFGLRLSLFVV